jgi:phospholipid/cholesterol/gamma-HCH transport system permease protein
MTAEPSFATDQASSGLTLRLSGRWTIDAQRLEAQADALLGAVRGARGVVLDLSSVEAMDTAGAWLIDRARNAATKTGSPCVLASARAEHEILLDAAHYRSFDTTGEPRGSALVTLLTDIGKTVVGVIDDLYAGVAFLGQIISALLRIMFKPARLRTTSVVFHLDSFGLRALPIIALINFLVGCIVAQQGVFQLQRFGAATFAVDLIGILVLRELAVLLTSVMVAGRSGSAITAEIGAMKMREEIDALRVMGLDPVEVLRGRHGGDRGGLAGGLDLWGHQPRDLPVALAERRRAQHLSGGPHQGALHGHRDCAHSRHGRLCGAGLGGIPWQAGHGLGGESHLHGDRGGWALRHVLCSDQILT